MLERQGHRLLQLGVAMLLFTSFEGFAIPHLAAPHIGLGVHRLSSLLGVLLPVFGLMWPRLNLGPAASRTAFWLLIYSSLAIDVAYLMAAIWGAGNSTLPIVPGAAHGTVFQETVIRIVAYSSATGIIAFALILWGLRGVNRSAPTSDTRA